MQTLARDEAAVLTGEEDEASSDLTGLTRTAHWSLMEFRLSVLGHSCGNERRPDCDLQLVIRKKDH
jgi:hypothetical protein